MALDAVEARPAPQDQPTLKLALNSNADAQAWRAATESSRAPGSVTGLPVVDFFNSNSDVPNLKALRQSGQLAPDEETRDARRLSALPLPSEGAPDEQVPGSKRNGWDMYENLTRNLREIPSIHRNMEPETITLTKDMSSTDLARQRLGKDASKDEIDLYAREITQDNGTELNFHAGDRVRLPGHKEDGSAIYLDARGARFTVSADGDEKVEYKDKTGYTKHRTDDGTTINEHFGPKPSDNFTVKQGPDGSIERTDSVPPERATDPAKEKAHLLELAEGKIGLTKERAAFKQDMEAFEERARKQGLPPDEVAQTYHEIGRLLEEKGNQGLSDRSRTRLALGVMRNAADPTSNDQGGYDTCNVTTVENRLYTREPSAAAKLVADVAATGTYTARDGTHVTIDRASLSAHGEAALNGARGSNERQYASQIFQVTAVNIGYAQFNESTSPPGDLRYVQQAPSGFMDNGERVYDYSKTPPAVVATDPGLVADLSAISRIDKALTGKDGSQSFLMTDRLSDEGDRDCYKFKDAQDLGNHLAELKARGELPAVIAVRANNAMFDTKGPLDHPLQDGHVVLITDYDPQTGMVKYDNQWGNKRDHIDKPVSIDEMYKATNLVPASEWLDRIQAAKPHLSDKRYADYLISSMQEYKAVWAVSDKIGKELDVEDRDQAKAKFDAMVAKLSPQWQKYVKKGMDKPLPDDLVNVIEPPVDQ